jgi:uncharacterized protein (TIGR00725 family)
MKLFVAGTWNKKKALKFSEIAYSLGKQIAERGHDLICGPGTGIAAHVVAGFRSVENRRGKVTFYLPSRHEMEKVGEVVGEGADITVETDFDYPMRNIFQIRKSDALFILTGGDGTLEEAIVALADYNLPVAAYKSSGTAIDALELLLPLFPFWTRFLRIGDDVTTLLDHISTKVPPKVD